PEWLSRGVLDRYHAGSGHLFLLHGNVRDVYGFGEDDVALADGLRRLTARRPVVVSYDVSAGLTFPDNESEQAFRRAGGRKAGALPADPARALVLLDALVTTDRCEPEAVAIILDYAHNLVPAAPGGSVERQSVTTLARWASDAPVAARHPLILLIAPSAGEVSAEVYAGASGAEVVEVPRPSLEAR